MTLRDLIAGRIRAHGPLPFAEYMDLALHHPALGYYARAGRRSGRAGDFYTSVDAGPVFGALLSKQFAEMRRIVAGGGDGPFALVEAGAGDGRLARDVLDAAAAGDPGFHRAVRLTLVERSPAARRAQVATLGAHAARLDASTAELPAEVRGVIFANELLDALPVHPIVMTGAGLREVRVALDGGRFVERPGPVSAPVRAHVERFGVALEPGWRAEVSPAAVRWVADAARRLTRGFLMLIDYGHEARELYSMTHAAGTLACYRRHRMEAGGDGPAGAPWLADPGGCDLTAHVDLTAVRAAAEQAGLRTLGAVDQTYFLLGLASSEDGMLDAMTNGPNEPNEPDARAATAGAAAIRRRLALKTLLAPGGLGSTHKVLIFGRGVGTPRLQGCSFSRRAT